VLPQANNAAATTNSGDMARRNDLVKLEIKRMCRGTTICDGATEQLRGWTEKGMEERERKGELCCIY